MRLQSFLDILHDTGEYVSFGIISPENPNNTETPEKNPQYIKEFKQMLTRNGKTFHQIGGVFDGKKENSFLIENISFNDLEDLAEQYNQLSFIYGKPSEDFKKDVVSEKGKTKYIFQYWEYNQDNNQYELLDSTQYIKIDQSLSDNYSFFTEDQKKWTMRFFEFFDPENSDYDHPYEGDDDMVDGVKESTLNRIREALNPRKRFYE